MYWLRRKLLTWGQTWIERGNVRVLAPLSFIWGAAVFLRNAYYNRKEAEKVRRTVVSVGNVEVGGTGKTPLVLLLAEVFKHRRVAILSRGYGGADEAKMLSRRAPWAKVYVGKDRVMLARRAMAEGAELIVLDDGMQYRRLARDFELATVGRKETRYLPWGRLRDDPERLKEADAVLEVELAVKRIVGRDEELRSLKGKEVSYFCGIARPERFRKTLEGLGAVVKEAWVLGDHEPVCVDALKKFVGRNGLVVTTEKDFVKLPAVDFPVYYLEMETRVVSGEGKWKALIEKIEQKIDNYCTYE